MSYGHSVFWISSGAPKNFVISWKYRRRAFGSDYQHEVYVTRHVTSEEAMRFSKRHKCKFPEELKTCTSKDPVGDWRDGVVARVTREAKGETGGKAHN